MAIVEVKRVAPLSSAFNVPGLNSDWYDKLREVIRRLNQSIDNVNDLQSQVDDTNLSIDLLDKRVTNAESDIQDIFGRLQNDEQDIDNLRESLTTVISDLKALSERVTENEGNIETLQQDVISINEKIDAINSKIEDINSTIESIEARVSQNESDISAIKEEQDGQNKRLDDIESINAGQNERLDKVESDISAIKEEQDKQNKRLDSIESINAGQNERLDAIDKEQAGQNQRLDALEGRQTTLEEDMNALEQKMSDLQSEFKELSTDLNAQMKGLRLAVETNTSSIASFQSQVSLLQTLYQQLSASVIDVDNRMNDIEGKFQAVDGYVTQAKESATEAGHSAELAEIYKDNAKQSADEAKASADAAKASEEAAAQSAKDAQDAVERVVPQLEDKVNGLEPRVKKNEDDIAELQQKHGELETSVNELKGSVEEYAEQTGNLSAKVDHFEGELQHFESDLEEIRNDVEDHETRIKALEDLDIDAVKGDITNLESTVNTLETDVEDLKPRVEQNESDISELKQKDTEIEGRVGQNESDISELKQKDTELEGRVEQNESDITELKQKDTEIEGRIEPLEAIKEKMDDNSGKEGYAWISTKENPTGEWFKYNEVIFRSGTFDTDYSSVGGTFADNLSDKNIPRVVDFNGTINLYLQMIIGSSLIADKININLSAKEGNHKFEYLYNGGVNGNAELLNSKSTYFAISRNVNYDIYALVTLSPSLVIFEDSKKWCVRGDYSATFYIKYKRDYPSPSTSNLAIKVGIDEEKLSSVFKVSLNTNTSNIVSDIENNTSTIEQLESEVESLNEIKEKMSDNEDKEGYVWTSTSSNPTGEWVEPSTPETPDTGLLTRVSSVIDNVATIQATGAAPVNGIFAVLLGTLQGNVDVSIDGLSADAPKVFESTLEELFKSSSDSRILQELFISTQNTGTLFQGYTNLLHKDKKVDYEYGSYKYTGTISVSVDIGVTPNSGEVKLKTTVLADLSSNNPNFTLLNSGIGSVGNTQCTIQSFNIN